MVKHESLIGNKYGKLEVVKLHDRKSGKIRWQCLCDCGNTAYVMSNNLKKPGGTKSCGCIGVERLKGRLGENSPTWKGGRFIDSGGYVNIYKPQHPNAKSSGYIREHRFIMSEILERPLIKYENVHHKNGDKTDNTPNNLELWNTSQPSGQRVQDKVKWAKEILELYGRS